MDDLHITWNQQAFITVADAFQLWEGGREGKGRRRRGGVNGSWKCHGLVVLGLLQGESRHFHAHKGWKEGRGGGGGGHGDHQDALTLPPPIPCHTILYSTASYSWARHKPWRKGRAMDGMERKGNATHPAPSGSWHSPSGLYIYICHRYPVPTRSRVFTNGLPTLDV